MPHPQRAPADGQLAGWEPDRLTQTEVPRPEPAAALAAVLGLPALGAGDPLPPFWHWLYFLRWPARAERGPDGHSLTDRFRPPLSGLRRMWAGGGLQLAGPLRLGEPTERTSMLHGVEVKRGRSGELTFVTVRHELRQRGRLLGCEDQELVYRSGPVRRSSPEVPPPSPSVVPVSTWQRRLHTDPVTLFGFSALTANTHRIHYDEPYATGVEGYPGVVVHGPLLALAMAELVRAEAPERRLATMRYRLLRPAYAGADLTVTGDDAGPTARLRVLGPTGQQHAQAEIGFAGRNPDA